MAISSTLKTFLDTHKVKYKSLKHPTVYTAQEIAAAQHVPGRQLAKCVLVKTERGVHLAVLPAIHLVDLAKLKTVLRVKKVCLANEVDIKLAFADVEVVAMSPFGTLYQVPTIVDKALAQSEEIVCNAGSHTETIKLRYRDFERLAKPRVGLFALDRTKIRSPKKRAASARGSRTGRTRRRKTR